MINAKDLINDHPSAEDVDLTQRIAAAMAKLGGRTEPSIADTAISTSMVAGSKLGMGLARSMHRADLNPTTCIFAALTTIECIRQMSSPLKAQYKREHDPIAFAEWYLKSLHTFCTVESLGLTPYSGPTPRG